ncbi:flap endonuclease-1 [Nanoarchaeota archaeon]
MGLQVGDIIPKEEISLEDLSGKVIAIDAFNVLYQFLTTIRQYDGNPLMDSKGRVTSHLSGLFYRMTNMMSKGLKPVFVFDGKPPKLKLKTQEARKAVKIAAYEKMKAAGSDEERAKYAGRTSVLTKEVIEESKELLDALGIPVVQAPSEGEAQAAFLVHNGDAYAVGSQDYDALLFGADRLVQNLTLAKTRKLASGAVVSINPRMLELKKILKEMGINREQLICLGILVGTDYNPKGVPGIGQKNALKLVKEHKDSAKLFEEVAKTKEVNFDWKEIFDIFMNHDLAKEVKIEFKKINEQKLKKLLMEHEFAEKRIDSAIDKVEGRKNAKTQKSLKKFF